MFMAHVDTQNIKNYLEHPTWDNHFYLDAIYEDRVGVYLKIFEPLNLVRGLLDNFFIENNTFFSLISSGLCKH